MHPRPITLARVTAAAIAASALFATAASAAPRDFDLDLTNGSFTPTGFPAGLQVPAGGQVLGTVGDDGAITVPAGGVTFPNLSVVGLTGSLQQVGTGTGTFDDATGAMTLNLPLRIAISGAGVPAGCAIGEAGDAVNLALKTSGSVPSTLAAVPLGGAPFNRATGAITLVDAAPGLPADDLCGGEVETLLGPAPKLGLIGTMAIPEKQVPQPVTGPIVTTPGGGTPPAPAQTPPAPIVAKAPSRSALKKLVLTGSKQKGIKSGGAVLGLEVDQPATAVLSASVKIAGVKKATKLAAIRRTLKTGRASVAVSFPSGLRRKVQRALRARKSVVVTIAVTATDATGTAITRSRQIRLTR